MGNTKEVFDTESFVRKAKEKHGNFYDYTKSVYTKSKEKLTIICPIHGEFKQTPNMHLKGQGCPLCGNKKKNDGRASNTEKFIDRAKKIHGDKYIFDKTIYGKNNKEKVCVTCKVHGDFMVRPNDLLSGYGCKKCANEETGNRCRKSVEKFITCAKQVHDGKYGYSKIEYVSNKEKVCIICPIHGEFWQTPNAHLMGHGCPFCNESKLEKKVNDILIENNINFERNKRFDWLKKQHLDFYLPEYNTAIECQGIQHLEPVDFSSKGKEHEYFKIVTNRDVKKNTLCTEHLIPIIYYHEFAKYFGRYENEAHNGKELIEKISSSGYGKNN